ncbi:G-protein coupled receptor 4-like [Engraulis encrasicolus]|uniref:G-protein coupled receptor 4-like n=1 Tax=Engraulis encrasicolus TaxID=184585 RepID=UPI002FD0092F
MEDFHRKSQDYINHTDWLDIQTSMGLHCWVILPIALPVVCLAICGLLSLIKSDHVVPVYVINLLISDVLQVCVKPIIFSLTSGMVFEVLGVVYAASLIACVGFMVCISGERYAMIAHPMWYRFHRTIRRSVLYCLLVWLAAFVIVGAVLLATFAALINVQDVALCLGIVHLLPYLPVVWFFVGTWRALSKSKAVSAREKRKVMGTLALVLFTYTVFFLPYVILMLAWEFMPKLLMKEDGGGFVRHFPVICNTLLSLSPMADPILYVLMRERSLLVGLMPCCCRRRQQRRQQRQHLQAQSVLLPTQQTTTTSHADSHN